MGPKGDSMKIPILILTEKYKAYKLFIMTLPDSVLNYMFFNDNLQIYFKIT